MSHMMFIELFYRENDGDFNRYIKYILAVDIFDVTLCYTLQ